MALLIWGLAVLGVAYIKSSVNLRLLAGGFPSTLRHLQSLGSGCRIFIAGSSPVVYGISAAELQRSTGCNAVNVGLLQINTQIDEYLSAVLKFVRPGDIVVFSDRRWTDRRIEGGSCSAGQNPLACIYAAWSFAPNLSGSFRLLSTRGTARDSAGDVLDFPPILARLQRISANPEGALSARLDIIDRQLQSVHGRGACLLLSGGSLLVDGRAMPVLQQRFSQYNVEIRERVGSDAWDPVLLETDVELFAMEGQHSSAKGRERWTQRIAAALAKRCLAPKSNGAVE